MKFRYFFKSKSNFPKKSKESDSFWENQIFERWKSN